MRGGGAMAGVLALSMAACAAGEVAPPIATHVEDWRDEVIYEIVVDRFDNGDPGNDWQGQIGPIEGDLRRHQGGDWVGITRRLDYLERLGVTTLWISPIVENVERTDYQDGYHGYWASSFADLNPRFGELEDLQELVASAHDLGMKVIIDVVINHAGRVFYYDFDGDGTLDPGEAEPPFSADGPYDAPIEWLTDPPEALRCDDVAGCERFALGPEHFHRRGQTTDGSPTQKQLGDFPTGLRDLDTDRADVVEAMVDTYVRWVELTDVDGFRLDAVPHAPHGLWRTFATEVRARLDAMGKRQFMLLGEVFDGDPSSLAGYTRAGGLDSVFDFSLRAEVIDGLILDGRAPSEIAGALEGYRQYYPTKGHERGLSVSPWQARIAFADNHDVPRLRYWIDDPWVAELAMTVLFTVDAIPAVYYGTEQAFAGGWGNDSREVMWHRGFAEDHRTFRHIARLAALRARSSALRRGHLRVVYASATSARELAPDAGLLAWERFDDHERVLVAVSGHPTDAVTALVPTGFAPGTELVDALGEGGARFRVDDDGAVRVVVPPREALVLEAR